jgi:hypothetical protein
MELDSIGVVMSHQVFISHSSRDALTAQRICAELEAQKIRCWIAPRDVPTGANYAATIGQAIRTSRALLLVFSEAADASEQVMREVEAAVSGKVPIVPVRISNVLPGEAMRYFLSVANWLDAFSKPIDADLPAIVAQTRRVLAGQRFRTVKGLPRTRWAPLAATVAAVVAVAVLTAYLMAPKAVDPTSPLAGRWQLDGGDSSTCLFDVQMLGMYTFSDHCGGRLSGLAGDLRTAPDGTYAPTEFDKSQDNGSFQLQSNANTIQGAFRVVRPWFGATRLELTSPQLPAASRWKRVADTTPLANDAAQVLPANVAWPLADVPALLDRATAYVRAKWQADALLIRFSADVQTPGGTVAANTHSLDGNQDIMVTFRYFSPATKQSIDFTPNMMGNGMASTTINTEAAAHSIANAQEDLPETLARLGIAQIRSAVLGWSPIPACPLPGMEASAATAASTAASAAPAPCAEKKRGIGWQIEPVGGERNIVIVQPDTEQSDKEGSALANGNVAELRKLWAAHPAPVAPARLSTASTGKAPGSANLPHNEQADQSMQAVQQVREGISVITSKNGSAIDKLDSGLKTVQGVSQLAHALPGNSPASKPNPAQTPATAATAHPAPAKPNPTANCTPATNAQTGFWRSAWSHTGGWVVDKVKGTGACPPAPTPAPKAANKTAPPPSATNHAAQTGHPP